MHHSVKEWGEHKRCTMWGAQDSKGILFRHAPSLGETWRSIIDSSVTEVFNL